MVWTRDDITTTAEKPTEVANLLNDYFYYMFKVPLSNDEYNSDLKQAKNLVRRRDKNGEKTGARKIFPRRKIM